MEARSLVKLVVNGQDRQAEVPVRRLLSDFIRHDLGLTGTHVGCEHGVCGCCTVHMDGLPLRSCLMFAVQAAGRQITTIEGLASIANGGLHAVQRGFRDAHGLQCGFCTPGFMMVSASFLEDNPEPSDAEIIEAISGNLCRCTGYQNIVAAVRLASRYLAEPATDG